MKIDSNFCATRRATSCSMRSTGWLFTVWRPSHRSWSLIAIVTRLTFNFCNFLTFSSMFSAMGTTSSSTAIWSPGWSRWTHRRVSVQPRWVGNTNIFELCLEGMLCYRWCEFPCLLCQTFLLSKLSQNILFEKPQLLQVSDRVLKYRLINDIMNIVLPPDGVPDVKWNKVFSKYLIFWIKISCNLMERGIFWIEYKLWFHL